VTGGTTMAGGTNGGQADTAGLRTGRDGRRYRASAPSPAERARTRRLAHKLVCELGLSIRAAQERMAEEYGVHRSRGAVWEDVAFYECPACSNRTPGHADTARTP
jgi:hypothetical protein